MNFLPYITGCMLCGLFTDHIYGLLVCDLEAGRLWLGLRLLIRELNVGSQFYEL